ncbi:hypothetical protein [Motilimonas sp. E26]|uniref:hypothetical protein n=1 Tax=Motilimonas sp. E26 TaxID=2865674 RepID=UPI001E65D4A0|nr:hypothetical protein [Motilimonas sp. E26]MCE0555565.1 hypothetical protein [Motilimonas sp. E26]
MKRKDRGCYCSLWQQSPETLIEQGVKKGYCGVCNICDQQGHLRHAPGAFPYTDAWCDQCFKVQSVINLLQALAIPMLVGSLFFQAWLFTGLAAQLFGQGYWLNNDGKAIIRKLSSKLAGF